MVSTKAFGPIHQYYEEREMIMATMGLSDWTLII